MPSYQASAKCRQDADEHAEPLEHGTSQRAPRVLAHCALCTLQSVLAITLSIATTNAG